MSSPMYLRLFEPEKNMELMAKMNEAPHIDYSEAMILRGSIHFQ